MQFVVMTRNVGLLSGISQRTPALGLTGSGVFGRKPRSTVALSQKLPSHGSMRVFPVSCDVEQLETRNYQT
jgi:hypothetical protein